MYFEFLAIMFLGRIKAGIAAEVEAETDTETETETETEPGIEIETRSGAIVLDLDPDPDLAPEIATEIETEANEGRSPPAGVTVPPVPERSRTGMETAGRTNMWTAPLQRNLLLGTSTMARSPASCSLDVSSNLRD